jgi:hypothetical protein
MEEVLQQLLEVKALLAADADWFMLWGPQPTLQQPCVQALTPSEQNLQERARAIQFICNRLQQAAECPRVRIEPFGSSASGLILPGSDLDLGLHGYWNSSTPVHLLPRQAKIDILTAMDKIIWRRRMALNGKVRSWVVHTGLLGGAAAVVGEEGDVSAACNTWVWSGLPATIICAWGLLIKAMPHHAALGPSLAFHLFQPGQQPTPP